MGAGRPLKGPGKGCSMWTRQRGPLHLPPPASAPRIKRAGPRAARRGAAGVCSVPALGRWRALGAGRCRGAFAAAARELSRAPRRREMKGGSDMRAKGQCGARWQPTPSSGLRGRFKVSVTPHHDYAGFFYQYAGPAPSGGEWIALTHSSHEAGPLRARMHIERLVGSSCGSPGTTKKPLQGGSTRGAAGWWGRGQGPRRCAGAAAAAALLTSSPPSLCLLTSP